jgi:hypothetical protein
LQDKKPSVPSQGTATSGTPKAPIKSVGASKSTPASATVKPGVHTTGTAGRKTFPNLSA